MPTSASRPWLRALYGWIVGDTPAPESSPVAQPKTAAHTQPARIGHYSIARKLGEGGMGVVYEARDERLGRAVAVKTMSALAGVKDDTARQRFWREARTAASVNHPHICQIYEIGEDAGTLYIAMELLEGQSLAERLKAGPLSVSEVLPIALQMLDALAALHARGLIHRDLKPANVFITPRGVKLLDFGLARPELEPRLGSMTGLTATGIVVGTPRYMAPEQVTGEPVDSRCDLFATAAVLFEMLAGRPAFEGATVLDILHRTVHEQPPALIGSPAVAAVDRVIRSGLSKRPADRPASAEAMAEALRRVTQADGSDTRALAQTLVRLVVLPFRILRADPETDFLAFSLPDAIATSLSRTHSLIVRSSATAARFADDAPDLKALSAKADVDRVVTGTILRSGDQLRAAVQLVDAHEGTLLASHTIQSSLGDLFVLQDDIARRVVEALLLPLGRRAATPPPDVPRDAQAYELYLRANGLARSLAGIVEARELYLRCLSLDPTFAPAWAHLGRSHRVIGKYIDARGDSEREAEEAFRRALALDSRLAIAHKFYATLEGDLGRSQSALVRLATEANRHGNDPELFAGLVQACRYCGLYEESLAAHAEARRLDPNVPTSHHQTLLMTGAFDRLLTIERPHLDAGSAVWSYGLTGRRDEARAAVAEMRTSPEASFPLFQTWTELLLAWLDRRPARMLELIAGMTTVKITDDPEAMFLQGWLLCDAGDSSTALAYMERAVAKGYMPASTLARSPQFDHLRSDPAFQALQSRADAGRSAALAAFRDADGPRLLGSF
ncbi:MAG: protein kinase [Vicinamibacterales bacterium]